MKCWIKSYISDPIYLLKKILLVITIRGDIFSLQGLCESDACATCNCFASVKIATIKNMSLCRKCCVYLCPDDQHSQTPLHTLLIYYVSNPRYTSFQTIHSPPTKDTIWVQILSTKIVKQVKWLAKETIFTNCFKLSALKYGLLVRFGYFLHL